MKKCVINLRINLCDRLKHWGWHTSHSEKSLISHFTVYSKLTYFRSYTSLPAELMFLPAINSEN